MKNIVIFTFVILAFSCKAQKKENKFEWNIEKERIHNENRNDSTKVDLGCWIADMKDFEISGKPLIDGVFPVPKYELADDSFEGSGNSGEWKSFYLKDKKIIYHSLYVKKNKISKDSIPYI